MSNPRDVLNDLGLPGSVTINFVDNNNDLLVQCQRFPQNKAGLWHRPLNRIDQKQHTYRKSHKISHDKTILKIQGDFLLVCMQAQQEKCKCSVLMIVLCSAVAYGTYGQETDIVTSAVTESALAVMTWM